MIGNNGSQSGGRIHASESVRLSDTRRSTTQCFGAERRCVKTAFGFGTRKRRMRREGGGRVFRRVV